MHINQHAGTDTETAESTQPTPTTAQVTSAANNPHTTEQWNTYFQLFNDSGLTQKVFANNTTWPCISLSIVISAVNAMQAKGAARKKPHRHRKTLSQAVHSDR